MSPWLPTIIYIFTIILIIDSLGSFAFWKYTQNRLFLKASIAWGANFINFAIHAAYPGHSSMTLVGHSFYFITACSLSAILCEVIHIKFPTKKLILVGISTLATSIGVFKLSGSYFFSALVLDLFIATPLLYYSYLAIAMKESPILAKVLAVLLILNGLHFLDYPFLHDDPVGSVIGFSLAFLFSILISILLPSLILQMSSRKYTLELESLVQERTAKLEERTQQLEEINKDNTTLVSIVCHDISTPIMIANYSLSKLMQPEKYPELSNQADIQKVQKNLNVVSEILRRVKEIHSVKLGKLEPQIQLYDVEPHIYEVLQMYQPLSEQKNISLHFTVKDQNKKMMLMDPLLFKNQILGNLISNAIKFSDPGQNIEVQLEQSNHEVIISVIDFGKGMDINKVSEIFNFNRPTTTKGTSSEIGFGLGLPTVKFITEKMGGRISVSSHLSGDSLSHKGTVFTLRFKSVEAN